MFRYSSLVLIIVSRIEYLQASLPTHLAHDINRKTMKKTKLSFLFKKKNFFVSIKLAWVNEPIYGATISYGNSIKNSFCLEKTIFDEIHLMLLKQRRRRRRRKD